MASVTSAVVLGASGSVGSKLVFHLLAFSQLNKLLLINRRHLGKYDAEPRVTQHIVKDMNEASMLECAGVIAEHKPQAAFITMGVGAPSKVTPEVLESVDVLIPSAFARAAKDAGAGHMGLLTSVGSDINAKPSAWTGTSAGGGLYSHLKGTIEKNVQDLKFDSTAIFQPAGLMGAAATPAFVEWLAPKLDFMLPKKWNSIQIHDLGRAMAYASVLGQQEAAAAAERKEAEVGSVKIYTGESLFQLVDASKAAPVWRKEEAAGAAPAVGTGTDGAAKKSDL